MSAAFEAAYPRDIVEAAKQAERVLMRAPFPDGGWKAIAKVLAAERERCAQVALNLATDVRNPQTARFTAGHIATGIRKPKQIESGANAAADSSALTKSNHEEAATEGECNAV